jgi:hypothetical protein
VPPARRSLAEPYANIRSVTSQGSPYARFQRALRIGRLSLVRAAAAELPQIDLTDALAICLLIERQEQERFERAAVRWLARLSLEAPTVGIDDLRQGLAAFEALPYNPAGARQALADLCARHGLARAAESLHKL